jgi:hypothetical protein
MDKTLKHFEGSITLKFKNIKILTPLEERILNLHDNIPINQYTTDDIRFMILQGYGISFLLPLALKYLEENILMDTKYYEGDLLFSVISINGDFWINSVEIKNKLYKLLDENKKKLSENLNEKYEVDLELIKKINTFKSSPFLVY